MAKSTIDRGAESDDGYGIREFLDEWGWKIAFFIGFMVMLLWPITMGIPTQALGS